MSSGKPEVVGSTKNNIENRVVELEYENLRLQRLVAELLLKNQQLRDAHSLGKTHDSGFDQDRVRVIGGVIPAEVSSCDLEQQLDRWINRQIER